MIICGIYPRKSKANDNSESMQMQIDMSTEHLQKRFSGQEIKIIVYDGDYAITGHSIKKRKDFQRMMNDVRSGYLNVIAIYKYDRVARNMYDFVCLYHELEKHHCDLISITQQIDTTTPAGKQMMYQMAGFAEYEWEMTSARYKDTAKYKIQSGYAYTGNVPTGYKIEVIDGHKRIVKDQPEAVMDIFNYYRNCKSKRATVVYAREKWFPDFTPNKFNTMLNSDLFIGKCRDNHNFCEPYFTEAEFDELRRITQIKLTPSGNIYLFTGLIRCPLCGASMCGIYANRKMSATKRKYYTYYRCSKGSKFKLHKINSLNQDTVEKYLLEHLDEELDKVIVQSRTETDSDAKTMLSQQLEDLQGELRRVNYMFEKGRITEQEYESKYSSLQFKIEELSREMNQNHEERILALMESIPENWREIYDKLTQKGKQEFWHRILSGITIDESFGITGFSFI